MRTPPNVQNINQYHDHFRQTSKDIQFQPKVDRSCNDKCCYIFFILITIVFISVGAYNISQANFNDAINRFSQQSYPQHNWQSSYNHEQSYSPSNNYSEIKIQNLKSTIPIISGMILLSIVISIVFLMLLVKFPKPMFYAMIIITFLILLAVVIVSFIAGAIVVGISAMIILLIYGCFLFCVRDKIPEGIVLLRLASSFIAHKPSIFLAPFFMMIFVVIFQVFWVGGLISISLRKYQSETPQQIQANQNIRNTTFFFWSLFQIFFSTFFYYCLVFLIATGCAMWYYGIDGFYLFTGVKRIIRYHIGSFTFAASLIVLVDTARRSANDASQSGGACGICFCLISCCLKFIEDLLEVLNHNSIIVMAVTGQSYIDSAKSTISLIFQNFALFFLVDMIGGIVKMTGSLLICGIPALIGFFLLRSTNENPDDIFIISMAVIIIIFASLLIGGLMLGLLGEALSCVFIFYCLDQKFQAMGYQASDKVNPQVRSILSEMNPYKQEQAYDRESGYPSLNNNMNSGYPNSNNPYGNA